MKQLVLALCLSLPAAPLVAEQSEPSKTEEGLSLLDQGAQLLFEGLLQEMKPALEDLKSLGEEAAPRFQAMIAEMGPALIDLLDRVDDIRNYEAPVLLDNGDILIRRKPDAPPYVAPEPEPDTAIDL